MLAKRFFYVCAGLFLLALTYHLGARTANSQSSQVVAGAGIDRNGGPRAAILHAGSIYVGSYNLGSFVVAGPFAPPRAGAIAAVGCGGLSPSTPTPIVVYEDGEWFVQGTVDNAPGWVSGGNLLGVPTAATPTTLGRLKDKYRR